FSFFLVGFTLLSFTLLYRNLLKQRRLADIKNEFISNITHELKTPIATVSVAIEALRSFNATMDPARTKEYLDISANELQRLSLLVDKVLKLSMFEKKEIELKYETLDMKDLVQEVTSSMRLQFEKHHASVQITSGDDTTLQGDRLHLVSVIFNLLDNALKYSSDHPVIGIDIRTVQNKLVLTISDSGIGIPAEYLNKVFEKFFRVPTGNLHNAKGYGLGLSYVAHVINRHKGTIKVESIEGDGSKFIVNLPLQVAA
ncbi:MAG: sensor histidine kinase, partial [Flavisolibacter sp.]